MRIVAMLALTLAGCGGSPAQSPAASSEAVVGYHCSEAFALALHEGERVTTASPMEDFLIHRLQTSDGALAIYEGNQPQPGGIVRETGLNWPSVVVIHEALDQPLLAHDVASRISLGEQRREHCPAESR